jgi:two-component system, cell cycle sensor histidine kinase and response regulator CckA
MTDMNMPLMDGSSTIRALRRVDPTIKIVVSSGLLTNMNSAGVSGLDIQGYMTKPYAADQLASWCIKFLKKNISQNPARITSS